MLHKKAYLILALILTVALMGAAARADDDFEFTVISGRVTDSNGNGVSGVRVQLHNVDENKTLQGIFTDSTGHWSSVELDAIVGYSYLATYYKSGYTFNWSEQSCIAQSGGTTLPTVTVSSVSSPSCVPSDYTYTPNTVNNTATIKSYTGTATAIRIPSEIDGYTVVSIGNDVFKNKTTLTTVWMPETLASIGNGVFYNDSGLTSVYLPNGLTSIGAWAFQNCTSLTTVALPDSLQSMDSSASPAARILRRSTIPAGGPARAAASSPAAASSSRSRFPLA